MKQSSTKEEISTAAKKLKSGINPGPDELEPELFKYALVEIHHK